jgi:hypothetical protein
METKLNISESSVLVNSFAIPRHYIFEIRVDTKVGFPDMAVVLIENVESMTPHLRSTASLEVKQTRNKQRIFKGEIYALDLMFKGGQKGRVLVRAINKLSVRR